MLDIRANLGRVQEAVARACARAGRSSDDVLLIAVSKTMDAERVRMAVAAGVAALGENRVQEAREKIEALGRPVPWHLIGGLQTNKARDAARLFDNWCGYQFSENFLLYKLYSLSADFGSLAGIVPR